MKLIKTIQNLVEEAEKEYNKVLTQSEITQNYNANKTQFGLQ